jgi:hypothetical protein
MSGSLTPLLASQVVGRYRQRKDVYIRSRRWLFPSHDIGIHALAIRVVDIAINLLKMGRSAVKLLVSLKVYDESFPCL